MVYNRAMSILKEEIEEALQDLAVENMQTWSEAQEFYAALCNTTWTRTTPSLDKWACTWRYAAALIADVAQCELNSYTDLYCSGSEDDAWTEGHVSLRVRELLAAEGFQPIEI